MEIEAAALSQLLMQFIGTPQAEVTKEAEAELARVSTLSRHRHDLVPLTAHGRLIMELLPRLDTLLVEVAASPTAARAEALQRAILEYAVRTEASAFMTGALPRRITR